MALCLFPALSVAAPADLQPAVDVAASRHDVTRVIVLGTRGGPPESARHAHTSVLLDVRHNGGEKFYLVDAGSGALERINRAGYYADQVLQRVFITHNHVDHNAGLGSLMATAWVDANLHLGGVNWSAKQRPDIQIWGPADTKAVVQGDLRSLSVSARIFNSGEVGHGRWVMPQQVFSEHSVTHDGKFYDDGTVAVAAAANTHYHFLPGSAAAKAGDGSYSYRFETPQGSIVFTGDTGPSENLVKLAKGADVLISEVIDPKAMRATFERGGKMSPRQIDTVMTHMRNEHLTPEYIGKMAARNHVKMVILYHFVGGAGTSYMHVIGRYRDASAFTAGVKRYYAGPVVAARDLFEYDLYKRGK